MTFPVSRFTKVLALGATLTLSLAACAGESSSADAEATSQDVRVWFMKDSVPESAATWLEEEFEAQNPGSDMTVEVQQWNGIVQKLQTSLASEDESPDIVEVGNTQVATFSSVGAFAPIGDLEEELGGEDLIQSFIDAGSWDGELYAAPFYAGARVIFYRTDLFEQAGIAVPRTIEELGEAAKALQAANPEGVPDFSGMYLAGADPHTNEGWLFTYGGQYAEQEGDQWVGRLSTPESLAALREVQDLYQNATKYALDSNENAQVAYELFNQGKVGIYSSLNYAVGKIDQALWDAGKVGVMPLPGLEPGSLGKTFSGGSSIGISANNHNQELSEAALKLMYSEEFQSELASGAGWIPGNTAYASALTGPTADISQDVIQNSELTPNSPQWGVVDGNNVPRDFWVRIARGEDVTTVAAETDATLEEQLNG
ncbi:extracellular solute-binding protein [Paenibacillus sp. TRM 82003]|uniref:extracellular solute-binding protein n=1 Tax=Kineococcus sp. TRM81007 TaxID=2925831 RepID=UPI001F5A1270|nr:extracellular solute-binding protein [Kineococcus sp. TRM81007]MCI2239413.1 extracellular solute-binding protein [Kineococcus sp. TRM81007]MCI3918783.1 extracellular solute-binding protein [Paenibacillus sp. TRM 82003]